MYKKTILIVPALLCLYLSASAQQKIEPFYIGDRVPDLPLHRIINYKDSTATLSSFGDKLIILDFWSVHCSSCIEMFPFEDSVQHSLNDKIQFILVTLDPKEKVTGFFRRWDSLHHTKFSLPVVYGDSVLYYLFRHHSVPHYAFLAPDGELLIQSHAELLAAPVINLLSRSVSQVQKIRYENHFPEDMLHFPKASLAMQQAMKKNKMLNIP